MMVDLSEGKVSSQIWRFSIPIFASALFQKFYVIADSVIAGRYLGEDGLAATGTIYPIMMTFMAIAFGSNIGCSVLISQIFGEKKFGALKTAIYTSMILVTFVSVIIMMLGLVSSDFLMERIRVPDNIYQDAGIYLKIYMAGFVFLCLYNVSTGIFTALGDSKTSLKLLVISSVINIILDLVFINLHMGVPGLAIATFMAQGFVCILSGVLFWKKLKLVLDTEEPYEVFSLSMAAKISRIAIPSIIQQGIVSIGDVFMQAIVNGYGSAVIAGYSAGIKLNIFSIAGFSALGSGISSFTAQNIGAEKEERIKKGAFIGVIMALIVAVPFFTAFFFFPAAFLNLYLSDKSADVISAGCRFLKITTPFYFIISLKVVADGVLRGAGAMKYVLIVTLADFIVRVIAVIFLSVNLKLEGVFISYPIGWTIGLIMSYMFYLLGVWRKSKQVGRDWLK
ncbi:MAG: MATE family efflux transporter [Anaerocolumna sp.]